MPSSPSLGLLKRRSITSRRAAGSAWEVKGRAKQGTQGPVRGLNSGIAFRMRQGELRLGNPFPEGQQAQQGRALGALASRALQTANSTRDHTTVSETPRPCRSNPRVACRHLPQPPLRHPARGIQQPCSGEAACLAAASSGATPAGGPWGISGGVHDVWSLLPSASVCPLAARVSLVWSLKGRLSIVPNPATPAAATAGTPSSRRRP